MLKCVQRLSPYTSNAILCYLNANKPCLFLVKTSNSSTVTQIGEVLVNMGVIRVTIIITHACLDLG